MQTAPGEEGPFAIVEGLGWQSSSEAGCYGLPFRVIWIALAIVLAAWLIRAELRRLSRGVAGLITILQNMGNRAAEHRGEPPVLSDEEIERIRNM